MRKLTALLILSTALPLMAANPPAARPNIVFILTDDQRWNALGCMGDTNAVTPNIDRLAQQGLMFQNHFVTTSICCVSRASIFTGQYQRRHGIGNFSKPLTSAQWAETYPALLRRNGYYTGFIGKFGVGNDKAVAGMAEEFDYWRGIPGQGGKYFIEPGDTNRVHQTARYGDQALEFLKTCPTNQPFCLSISFTAPHARDKMPRPYTPDDRDETLYRDESLAHRVNDTEADFKRLPEAVQTSEAHRRWDEEFGQEEKFQSNAKDYYRLIRGIDREVGRIQETLAARGLSPNTVVIFTSDNGYALGDRHLQGKWFLYEESVRVPLIVYDPREPVSKRGLREDAMTLNIDFAPTMLDLAGIKPPLSMQGRSLLPLVNRRPPAGWRTDFFYEHDYAPKILPPSEGVRTERWVYFRWVNEQPVLEELFDVSADPLERTNLATNPEAANTLAALRERWQAYSKELR